MTCPMEWCTEPPDGLTAETTDDELLALACSEQQKMLARWPDATDEDGTMLEILDGWREKLRDDKLLPPTDGYWSYEQGVIVSYHRGQPHNSLGPAKIYDCGDKVWYINGLVHRADGPAVELNIGTKYWRIEGILHRLDGPAIEYYTGETLWYVTGHQCSKEDFPTAVISFLLGIENDKAKTILETISNYD